MYGQRFDWHTLEGPSVIRHAGRYYCLYSAGRWDSDTYGVDYAVADSICGPYANAGGPGGPRLLRTVPGHLIGPGHVSLVLGPDGVTEHVAYHAWDARMTARRLHIATLEWTDEGPRCVA
jgi:GH43 family beta-xylosidase